MNGPLPLTLFRDAMDFEDEFYSTDSGEWRDWQLLAADGHTAAFLQLLSENKVNLDDYIVLPSKPD